jgi:hypothetical protein
MKAFISIACLLSFIALLTYNLFRENLAVTFLNSLDKEQRAKAQLEFDNPLKSNWHFIPGSMWPRAGIPLGELDKSQKRLFMAFLESSLSAKGYQKTMKIIDLEKVLREISGDSVMRDPEKYFVAFFGDPENDSLWAWSFEGHHISLNFAVVNGKTAIAPRFLGANPAVIATGPRKGEQTLGREENLGLELVNSLTGDQKRMAIFQKKPFFGITTANSIEVGPLSPVGIPFGELNEQQQETLLELITEYLSTVTDDLAFERMENLKREEINALRFGWAGAIEPGLGHYYRIQGKSFLIEFDNTQGNANHIHSVWRDFNGDFGRDLIREHYSNSNHH